MKGLVLDFDGVISDSAREAFLVALRAHVDLHPDSLLASGNPDRLYPAFLEMIPLGNRAEDYGTAMIALERGIAFVDQEAYDAFRRRRDPEWLTRYHRRFYEVRTALSEEDEEGWLRLMTPYGPWIEILSRRSGEVAYAIATSKDRRSVEILLRHYGIDDLFASDRILDKETGASKDAHLDRILRETGIPPAELTFVDDKVNHLDSVAPLGVRCALATWGYNGTREHALARRRGYVVCTLADVERQLFDSS